VAALPGHFAARLLRCDLHAVLDQRWRQEQHHLLVHYFQSSSDGGTTWSSVGIPRCPVNGNVVDAQLALGANHRIYASYMDGNAQYTLGSGDVYYARY
jgi:hypothetical protein